MNQLPPSSPRTASARARRKTRITIYLDDEVLEQYRIFSETSGQGYQTLINAALRKTLAEAAQGAPALA